MKVQHENIDKSTKAQIFILNGHHEIHDGSHFFIQGSVQKDDTATFVISFTTPATALMHLLMNFSSTLHTSVELLEGAVLGAGGTAITPLNSRRDSSNTSGGTFKHGQTITTPGPTSVYKADFGSDTAAGTKGTGGSGGREEEIILKAGTSYTLTITSNTNANVINYYMGWYEHTDKVAF